MNIDVESVDAALTTTRAVRLRLDLGRDVDNDIIYDCIDIAEQAPSGGNQGSRRWVIVHLICQFRASGVRAATVDVILAR